MRGVEGHQDSQGVGTCELGLVSLEKEVAQDRRRSHCSLTEEEEGYEGDGARLFFEVQGERMRINSHQQSQQ